MAQGAGLRPLLRRMAALPVEERVRLLRALTEGGQRSLVHHWPSWAHDGQLAPAGDWRVWLIRAGRGFGKTRAGAEWVSALARATPGGRIALVGATAGDVARVMVEGESGLIAVAHAGERYHWSRDQGVFTFASGAKAFVYSAVAPDPPTFADVRGRGG
ncbi:hypothetical protein SAMN05192583_1079 [Sphingomonas gellani]|uniref:Uncharacterized protein n=1 Tax=Sphingomonas gellani TaxID=1166340 RepID=A0A1H8AXM2_9SPHN|nr:hypothetical protein SAMN05192583_1079 [Sphingomonas gellani]